jgi:hypothetical protein
MANLKSENRQRRWFALAGLLLISAVMYGSIMYKIINYGP